MDEGALVTPRSPCKLRVCLYVTGPTKPQVHDRVWEELTSPSCSSSPLASCSSSHPTAVCGPRENSCHSRPASRAALPRLPAFSPPRRCLRCPALRFSSVPQGLWGQGAGRQLQGKTVPAPAKAPDLHARRNQKYVSAFETTGVEKMPPPQPMRGDACSAFIRKSKKQTTPQKTNLRAMESFPQEEGEKRRGLLNWKRKGIRGAVIAAE